jgi:hypothetical protein
MRLGFPFPIHRDCLLFLLFHPALLSNFSHSILTTLEIIRLVPVSDYSSCFLSLSLLLACCRDNCCDCGILT